MKTKISAYLDNVISLSKTSYFKKFKLGLAILIVLSTFVLLYRYISNHHEISKQLGRVSLLFMAEIILLYGLVLYELVLILKFSLKIIGVKISTLENFLLNSYSLMVNFFMFGQSGPGLRALYLKTKYKVKIKLFFYLTLLYYFYYFLISLGLVALSIYNNPTTYLVILAVLTISFTASIKFGKTFGFLSKKSMVYLFFITALQLITQTIIFGLELGRVSSVSFVHLLAYSGFANLSLFASITPAGIGIRESILLLSRKFSHFSSASIVSASVIDRSVYIVYLIIILVFILVFHSSGVLRKLKTLRVN